MVASTETKTVVPENAVFVLKLDGELSDRSSSNPIMEVLFSEPKSIGLDGIISSIKKAKENPSIKGIYIDSGSLSASFASLEAIRDALIDFKESDKFIVSYADQYSQGLYYLSSVADEVHLNPKGGLNWSGLSATPMFYTELFKKVGVEMQIFKVGTYKSAVEPYTETKMSQANREQVSQYLNDIWLHITHGISEARDIELDKLNEYADQMVLFQPAEFCTTNGLVDKLSYRSDMDEVLKEKVGEKPSLLSLNKMVNIPESETNKAKDKIAIYYASGGIVDFSTKYSSEEIVEQKMSKDLKKLEDNDDIKAVVLRVNSPGGSAYASEQIWKAVSNLKAKKPVIVSMGDYAASGGYYISAAADYILAEPTTLTGSIGIFAIIPNVEGTTKKLGLTFDVVKTNKHSDFGSIGRALNQDEKLLLQNYINSGYDLFIQRCAEGRNMSNEKIREIGEGRVWTGKRAKELGLVDEIGGMKKAIEIAADKAGISEYKIQDFPKQKEIFEQIFDLSGKDLIKSYLFSSDLLRIIDENLVKQQLSKESILQARLPYLLNIQ